MTSQSVTNISWRHKIFDGMVFMFIKLFDIDGDQTWRWIRRSESSGVLLGASPLGIDGVAAGQIPVCAGRAEGT